MNDRTRTARLTKMSPMSRYRDADADAELAKIAKSASLAASARLTGRLMGSWPELPTPGRFVALPIAVAPTLRAALGDHGGRNWLALHWDVDRDTLRADGGTAMRGSARESSGVGGRYDSRCIARRARLGAGDDQQMGNNAKCRTGVLLVKINRLAGRGCPVRRGTSRWRSGVQ